jgi:isopenicillin N synthase-like dioxygenase
MSSVALGLGLPQEFFAKMIDEQYHNLRLLHYPPVPDVGPAQGGKSRAGAHSGLCIHFRCLRSHSIGSSVDYGSLTFVFQDNVRLCLSPLIALTLPQVGGLEVQNPHTGHYHPATPIVSPPFLPNHESDATYVYQPGTVVVNVGDLLARWSNDVLRSTLHRVVTTAGKGQGGMKPSRQSIAFFCNPNGRAKIEALPTCVASGSAPKYQPVETEQYIVQRLTDTYS